MRSGNSHQREVFTGHDMSRLRRRKVHLCGAPSSGSNNEVFFFLSLFENVYLGQYPVVSSQTLMWWLRWRTKVLTTSHKIATHVSQRAWRTLLLWEIQRTGRCPMGTESEPTASPPACHLPIDIPFVINTINLCFVYLLITLYGRVDGVFRLLQVCFCLCVHNCMFPCSLIIMKIDPK